MSLSYQSNGNLEPGIYELTWEEFITIYGYNKHRKKLILGIEKAISELKDVGCKTLYLDGSFVSKKTDPKDFDACWDPSGMDFAKLANHYPILMEFLPNTAKQKATYGGELFPSTKFLAFFQKDRDGFPKGIIKLSL